MVRIKEGFKAQRLLSLPEDMLTQYSRHPLIAPLYIRKIGFFPTAKFHYIAKDNGVSYFMLIYCVKGKGWYNIFGNHYEVKANQYIIIPSRVPYSFGSDEEDPWTIYWLHFKGKLAADFLAPSYAPLSIPPSENSRIQHRLDMFEEIYEYFQLAYVKEYMIQASMSLYPFLSSFLYVNQFRNVKTLDSDVKSFSTKVVHFMSENLANNLTLAQMANEFKYSASHFSALFEKETGMSPINYYIHLRIRKACEYAELSNLKFAEIALKVGFEEPSYFCRIFTKVMGMSPTQYRLYGLKNFKPSEDSVKTSKS
jgi:AraC family transcriptional regulator, arabinose operon regulatory protein